MINVSLAITLRSLLNVISFIVLSVRHSLHFDEQLLAFAKPRPPRRM